MIWAHPFAHAGVRCHDCPTNTTGKQCVVLIARQPRVQSDYAQLHGTQWVHHVGQCSVKVSAYDASPLPGRPSDLH